MDTKYLARGSYFNLRSYLGNHVRNSGGLVGNSRNKEEDSERVGFDVFEGKVVMICCFSLPDIDWGVARAVSLVSSELHVFGAFELLLVVNVSCGGRDEFDDVRSRFPSFCLAVPYSDCDEICESLNFVSNSEPTAVLINRNQSVEWHKPINFLLEYGSDAYPFTAERLSVISEMERNYFSCHLRSSTSYYLSSRILPFPKPSSILRKNPGGGPDKALIMDFPRKSCVGLYLCYTGNLIPTLDQVHKSCYDSNLEFDIILVYLPFKDFADDPQLFQDRINLALEERGISWWVLPYVYWVSRRLWRLCHKDTDDRLIIIDLKKKSVEPHGEAIVRHFGIGAYPFSRKLLLERELEMLRAVTLDSLLGYGSRDYLLRKDSCYHEEPIISLQGKCVLLYLGYSEHHSDKFYDQLVEYYHQIKGHEFEFEVVFVGLNTKSFLNFGSLSAMPWLICPFDSEHSDLVSKKIFRGGDIDSTLVAFGKDGRICSVRAQQLICSSCLDSPFTDNLWNEMIAELFGSRQLPECCM